MYKLKEGNVVIFKSPHEIEKEYGKFNEDGWIQIDGQSYGIEMHDKYKNILYVILRVEGDRVILYDNALKGCPWQKITVGMLKRVYKIKN